MKYLGPAIVAAVGFVLGWLIWKLSPQFAGRVEPWDSESAYYPLSLFLSGVIASLPSPRWFWWSAIGVCVGQSVYLSILIANSTSATFGHLGLVFTAFYSGLSMFGGLCVFSIGRLLRKSKEASK